MIEATVIGMSNNWLSQDQQRFVKDHVQKFQDAKSNGTESTFYEEFYASWFTKFPELKIAFPDANTMDDLSMENKEELEWHINNRKAVCFNIFN